MSGVVKDVFYIVFFIYTVCNMFTEENKPNIFSYYSNSSKYTVQESNQLGSLGLFLVYPSIHSAWGE